MLNPTDETIDEWQVTDEEMISLIKRYRRCENRLQNILGEIELMDHPYAGRVTHALMAETFDWGEPHIPAKKLLDPKTWGDGPQS